MSAAVNPRRSGHRSRAKPRGYKPLTSAEAVRRATGRDRDEWFALLDSWGARGREHRDIAAWLEGRHEVDHWWAQTLTVDYERARGLRAAGGSRDGTFAAGATKTIAVSVGRLFEAFVDAKQRKRWLPGVALRLRTSQPKRSARFDWEDGATRVYVGFTAKGRSKSQAALLHERLPNARAASKAKAFWRERLADLSALLEG